MLYDKVTSFTLYLIPPIISPTAVSCILCVSLVWSMRGVHTLTAHCSLVSTSSDPWSPDITSEPAAVSLGIQTVCYWGAFLEMQSMLLGFTITILRKISTKALTIRSWEETEKRQEIQDQQHFWLHSKKLRLPLNLQCALIHHCNCFSAYSLSVTTTHTFLLQSLSVESTAWYTVEQGYIFGLDFKSFTSLQMSVWLWMRFSYSETKPGSSSF